MSSSVLLSDENGMVLGEASVDEAHSGKGLLHRAFSVFVFNPETAEMLIQHRSAKKRLWPLVWANSCCSHLRRGEEVVEAGGKRLWEEMGFTCPLYVASSFVYRAEDPPRGVEYEYDTILLGKANPDVITPNPDEVAQWKWISLADLQQDMKLHPLSYAPWFHLGLAIILRNSAS